MICEMEMKIFAIGHGLGGFMQKNMTPTHDTQTPLHELVIPKGISFRDFKKK